MHANREFTQKKAEITAFQRGNPGQPRDTLTINVVEARELGNNMVSKVIVY
jgi:hypothetical protein